MIIEYNGHLYRYDRIRPHKAGFWGNDFHQENCQCGAWASFMWDDGLVRDIEEMRHFIVEWFKTGYAGMTLEEYLIYLGYGVPASRAVRVWHFIRSMFA